MPSGGGGRSKGCAQSSAVRLPALRPAAAAAGRTRARSGGRERGRASNIPGSACAGCASQARAVASCVHTGLSRSASTLGVPVPPPRTSSLPERHKPHLEEGLELVKGRAGLATHIVQALDNLPQELCAQASVQRRTGDVWPCRRPSRIASRPGGIAVCSGCRRQLGELHTQQVPAGRRGGGALAAPGWRRSGSARRLWQRVLHAAGAMPLASSMFGSGAKTGAKISMRTCMHLEV